jgi:hypothetical protein
MQKKLKTQVLTLVRFRKNAHGHNITVHVQRVTLYCIATEGLYHLHLHLLCHENHIKRSASLERKWSYTY